MIHVTKQDDL